MATGIIQFYENAHARVAMFRGNGWGSQPAPSSTPTPGPDPVTSIDSDGDGIPNTWETANGHNPNSAGDASSDFDFDGLTEKQEYDLSVRTGGQYGNPIGKYELTTIPDPPDYSSLSSVTLIETAKNGMTLVRVIGVRSGASALSTRVYTYSTLTGQWTWVVPPSSVPVTTLLNAFDVNSLGQVVGSYSTSVTKGFLWTPSSSNPSGGESKQFFIDPAGPSPTAAFPRRISDTGYLLYSIGSPVAPDMKAADPKQRSIEPVVNSWAPPKYLDVNDFGEYVGTIVNPMTLQTHTFLAIPDGPYYLSVPTTGDLVSNGLISPRSLDESTIQWQQIPVFVYPDDYYAGGDYRDPYDDYPDRFDYDHGTALVGGVLDDIRRDVHTGVIYWKDLSGNNAWHADTVTLAANTGAVNDWGEFAGGFTSNLLEEDIYYDDAVDENGNSYQYSDYYSSQYSNYGTFLFNGNYHFVLSGQQVVGMSNDPQLLLSSGGGAASHICSDTVVVPLGKLLPAGYGIPIKTKLCDNGLIVLQRTPKILQTLTPADDMDGDGMPDDWEVFYGFNPNLNDANGDADNDGTTNLGEFLLRTDPNTAPVYDPSGNLIDTRPGIDTDGDGMPNSWECANGLNYNDSSDASLDFDRDGYTNLQEFHLNTDPRGAPSYRIREIGPMPGIGFFSMAPALLGESPELSSPAPPGSAVTDSFYFLLTTGYHFPRPAAWNIQHGAEVGSYTAYPPIGLTAVDSSFVAHSVSGAALSITGNGSGGRVHMYYWSSQFATPASLPVNNIASLDDTIKMSPGGKNIAGNRRLANNPGVLERMIWKMPAGGQNYVPVGLPTPEGATIDSRADLYVNDYGYVATNATIAGKKRAVLWQLNAAGTAVTTTVLSAAPDSPYAATIGISNQAAPIVAGSSYNSSWQSRATVWKIDGSAVDLGTLGGGDSSSLSVISAGGLVGGVSKVLVNGTLMNQPFIGSWESGSSSWRIRAVGNPGEDFSLQKITDAREMIGAESQTTSVARSIPILWRSGLAYPLDSILPVSSGFVFPNLVSMNENGSLLVTATKNGALTYLMLTTDSDTDSDGFPDSFEVRNGFNPFVKNDPDFDTDGDGLSDIEEFGNGTKLRESDSDGDGMTDGWEVNWGLLPLDPTDAVQDPDGDGVNNLREFQIGTSPTGIYRLDERVTGISDEVSGYEPNVVSVGEDGTVIFTGSSFNDRAEGSDGYYTETIGVRYWFLPPGAPYSPDDPIPLRPFGDVYGYDINNNQVLYTDSSYRYTGVDPVSNTINELFVKSSGTVENYQQSRTVDSLSSPDASYYHAETKPWFTWQQVQDNLHASVEGAAPVLGAGDSLDAFPLAVSESANLRIHYALPSGERLMLDAQGGLVEKLPANLPFGKMNNQGDIVSLAKTFVAASAEIPAYYSGVVTWGRRGVVSTIPVALAPGISVNNILRISDSGAVVIDASETTAQGTQTSDLYLLDLNTRNLTHIKHPALGIESIISVSAKDNRMVGNGPKPFEVMADGSCVKLESLRVRATSGGAVVPFCTLYTGSITPHYVNKDGLITLTVTDAAYHSVVLQLVPEADTDNDGVPDDWERSVIAQLNASGAVTSGHPISTDVSQFDVNADHDGDGKTVKEEWQSGTSDGSTENVQLLSSVPKNPKDRDGDGILNADDADPDDKTVDWMKVAEPVYVMRDLGEIDELTKVEDLTINGDILTERNEDSYPYHPVYTTYLGKNGQASEVVMDLAVDETVSEDLSSYLGISWDDNLLGSKGVLLDYPAENDATQIFSRRTESRFGGASSVVFDTVTRTAGGELVPMDDLTVFEYENGCGLAITPSALSGDPAYDHVLLTHGESSEILPDSDETLFVTYPHGHFDLDLDKNVCHSGSLDGKSTYWEYKSNGGGFRDPIHFDGQPRSTSTLSQTIPSFTNFNGTFVPARSIERHLAPTGNGLFVAPQGGGFTNCVTAAHELRNDGLWAGDVTSDGWISANDETHAYMWVNGNWRNLSDYVLGKPNITRIEKMQENGMAAVRIANGTGKDHLGLLIPVDATPEIGSGSPNTLEPSNPSYVREVKLSGMQKTEAKPQESAEIDLPGEDTSVDALNRHLRHDTSIAYVDVPASDLDLAVKLTVDNTPVGIPGLANLVAASQGNSGSTATQATFSRAVADAARENIGSFGLGWRSTLDAKVVCKPKFLKMPKAKARRKEPVKAMNDSEGRQFIGYDVDATDENGQTYHFFSRDLQLFQSSNVGMSDISAFGVSLNRDGSSLKLSHKYGTSTKFNWTTTPSGSQNGQNSTVGSWDIPTPYFATFAGIEDRFGNKIALSGATPPAGAGSSAVALSAGARPDLKLILQSELLTSPDKTNRFSLVTSVINPRGFQVKLVYDWVDCWGASLPVLAGVLQPDGTSTSYRYSSRLEHASGGNAAGGDIWGAYDQGLTGQAQGGTAIERALKREDADEEYGDEDDYKTFFHLNLSSVADSSGKVTSIEWGEDVRYDTTLTWQKYKTVTADPNYPAALKTYLEPLKDQIISFCKEREWKKIDKSMGKRKAIKIGEGMYVTKASGVPDVVKSVSIASATGDAPRLGFTIQQQREAAPTAVAPGALPSAAEVSNFLSGSPDVSGGAERQAASHRDPEIITLVTDFEGKQTTYRFSKFQTLMVPPPPEPGRAPGAPTPPAPEPNETLMRNRSLCKGLGYGQLECIYDVATENEKKVTYEFDAQANYALKTSSDLSGNVTRYEHNDQMTSLAVPTTLLGTAGSDGNELKAFINFDEPNVELRPSGGILPVRKEFKYNAARLMIAEVDGNGNETIYKHDCPLSQLTEELSYEGRHDTGHLVSKKTMEYSRSEFPNFVTRQTVSNLHVSGEPTWVSDLVTTYEPDTNGFVKKTTVDPDGLAIVTEKTYDKGGNVLTSKDARNNVTTFAYDKVGHLVSTTYPDLTTRTFAYDSGGRKIRETDENGHSTLWQYDGFGRVVKTGADMNGNDNIDINDLVTTTTYNNLGQPLTVKDPKGNVTTYGYDGWHRLVSTTDALGSAMSFDYSGPNSGTGLANDPKWLPTRAMDSRGFVTETTYDSLYRTTSVKKEYQLPGDTSNWATRTLGPCTEGQTKFDDNGNATESTVICAGRAPLVTKTVYDGQNRPTLLTTASGTELESSSETLYTSTGLSWKSIAFKGNGALERQSVTEYDGAGRAVKTCAADPVTGGITANSAVSETHYDNNSNVDYTIDPLGNRSDFEYDLRNRKSKTTSPQAADASVAGNPPVRAVTTTTYDNVGNVSTVTDHYGTITQTLYDPANRATQITTAKDRPEQAVSATVYDANGNVTLVTDANGNKTRNFYDAANRLVGTAVNPVSGDPSASLQSPAPNDIVVANVYDAGGNLIRVADGAASKSFSGTAWALSSSSGHVTGFTYDGIGRKLATIWDVGSSYPKTDSSVYDALHQIERVDAQNRHTQYSYDVLGRLDEVHYISRSQDDRHHFFGGGTGSNSGPGSLDAVTHPNAGNTLRNVSYTHDRLDRVTAETSAGVTHQYAYDKGGNRVLVTYGKTGRSIVSRFDTGNRLASSVETTNAVSNPLTYAAQGSDRTTTYRYDALGHPVRLEMPNATATVKTFDRLGRVLVMNTLNNAGTVISGYNYTGGYDKVGNVLAFFETTATLPARTIGNLYDKTYRLTKEGDNSFGGDTYYSYDKACNRTGKTSAGVSQTYQFGIPSATSNSNQLVGYNKPGGGTVSLTYDASGNRATRSESGQTDTYVYDYDNRLVGLTKNTSGTGHGGYAYQYDYRTRRVYRDEPDTTGTDAALSFSGGLSVQEYAQAPGGTPVYPAVETLRGSDLGGGVGGVLYTLRGNTPTYDSYNSRGDVVSQTGSNGAVQWQASYEAFGTRKAEQAAPGATNLDRQRANTKDEDPTGLLNEGMRYRDLETGVFITRDPAGFVDGPNVYTYVMQNPWTSFDPDGLKTIKQYKDKIAILRKKAAEKDAKATAKGYKGPKWGAASGWNERWQIKDAEEAIEGIEETAKSIKEYTGAEVDANSIDDEWSDYKSLSSINFWNSFNPEKEVGDDFAKGNYRDGAKHFARDVAIGLATDGIAKGFVKSFAAEGGIAAKVGSGCFIAGTVIATADGPRPIESLHLGERVLTPPTEFSAFSSTKVDASTWRRVSVKLADLKKVSAGLRIEMLRSRSWLGEAGCRPGAEIWLEIQEMGLSGWAEVLEVGPCPEIRDGPGRVVLSTMTRDFAPVMELTFQGAGEALHPTPYHLLYSITGAGWTPAFALKKGDVLRTRSGTQAVESVTMLHDESRVFNLEVEDDHCYFVGGQGVLSHNSCPLPELEFSASKYPELTENIVNAQKAGHPEILTHGGDVAANRAAALEGVPNIKPFSRDEYPFASSMEGGAGSWVGHVPASQQSSQGALMKNFFRKYSIQPGDQYRVVIKP